MAPAEIVETLSMRKAQAVADQLAREEDDGIIVGSDTIVVLDGAVLGKPTDDQDAIRMLSLLQGRQHQVYSGVACISANTGRSVAAHRVTQVHMKPLSQNQIANYVATGEPSDKAGAYGIQGIGAVMIDRIEGDYFNVVGLPVSLLADLLKQFDIHVL
jgi:septum formation protein